MSEGYEFYAKVFLPNDLITFQCKNFSKIENGVELLDVKGYEDDVTIINTPVIITTEIHGGVGAALV